MEREQDIEAPKLKILLFESLVAVYCSVLINALVFYDCSTLWRLLPKEWNDQMWNILFGGGCLTEYKYRVQPNPISLGIDHFKTWINFNSILTFTKFFIVFLEDESSKQRLKVMKKLTKVNFQSNSNYVASSPPKNFTLNGIGSGTAGGSGEEKVYVREHFVAPEISMINYFLKKIEPKEKVTLPNEKNDSDEECELKDQVKDDEYDEDEEIELK